MNNQSKRKHRVVTKVKAVSDRPRLHVYRSNRKTYAQVIDATNGKVLAAASEKEVKDKKGSKSERAREIGRLVAQKAIAKKVAKVVFIRGAYNYHGRVRAVAEGAREKGLVF